MEDASMLFAHKALLLIPGLSEAARRVAGAILAHYNMKTGQCDPSNERLASMLDLDRATVIRATNKLHDENLITKIKHGGSFHRTAYEPNFALFNSLVAEWDSRMKGGNGSSDPCRPTGTPADTPAPKVAILRPIQSQDCDFEGRRIATQTSRINSSNKLVEDERSPARERTRPSIAVGETKYGLGNGQTGLPSAKNRNRAKVASNVSSQFAAEERAKARLGDDLRALGPKAYGEAIDHIDDCVMEAATLAEVKRRGDGLRVLMDQVGPALLRSAAAVGRRN